MKRADVCLVLEGTYPYVTGGVSSWTHDLLQAQQDLTFHLVTLLPKDSTLTLRYQVPGNVVGQTPIVIQGLPAGGRPTRRDAQLIARLEPALLRLQSRGGLADLRELVTLLGPVRTSLGADRLMNSPHAWSMLVDMYRATVPASSFLDFFWSWRSLAGGLFSVLLADLPDAGVYHGVSTGYAGLVLARAAIETGRPAIVTEHGIYTNERRIEMATARWLHDPPAEGLQIDRPGRTLRDVWVDSFVGYSHCCYEACREIITLYEGNQQFQLQDGAPPEKLRIIPNGIDYDAYAGLQRAPGPRRPTVALIGRVVPIKDIKTFIRACAMLRQTIPDVEALVMGPTDEDEAYHAECVELVRHLKLENTVTFTGRVVLKDYFPRIDVLVLTSISEAQPLVVLEAGAAGIPSVTTDVGSCRELLYGRRGESPVLGPGGDVTPLCHPSATAHAMAHLLTDRSWYERCSRAIKERVRVAYHKRVVDQAYRDLYMRYLSSEAAA
jgi:glycosyltransferase involved in cell wall biosynthesis